MNFINGTVKALKPIRSICNAWMVLLLLTAPLMAQEAELQGGSASQLPDAVQLEARIAELETVAEQDPASKAALEQYRLALGRLSAEQKEREEARRYRQVIDTAARQKQALQSSLELVRGDRPKLPATGRLTLEELTRRLDMALADHQAKRTRLSELETHLADEQVRPAQSSKELAESRLQLAEAEADLDKLEAEAVAGVATEARRVNLLATQQVLKSRISRLELERLSHGTRLEILRLSVDLALANLQQADVLVDLLQERLNQRRSDEADRVREEADKVRREASGKHPLIRQAAEENARISSRLTAMTASAERAVGEQQRVNAQLKLVQRSLERVRNQLEIEGLSDVLGGVLRAQRKELPEIRSLNLELDRLQQQIADVRMTQFQLEDQIVGLLSEEAILQELERLRPGDQGEETWWVLRDELYELYLDRGELLARLRETAGRHEKRLGDLALEQRELRDRVKQYGELLDRNLIWIPSTSVMDWDALQKTGMALAWLLSGPNWADLLGGLYARVADNLFRWLAAILVVGLLLFARPALRRRLEKLASHVGNVTRDSVFYTLRAFLVTLLLALPWVLLVAILGRALIQSDVYIFTDTATVGFRRFLVVFLVFQVVRYILAENGLAEAHFRWNRQVTRLFQRHLRWFVPVWMISIFVFGLAEWTGDELFHDSLGRSAFLLGVILIAAFAHATLNPWSGFPSLLPKQAGEGWGRGALWYPLALFALLAFLVLAYEGYFYTALRFEELLLLSILSGLLAFLLYSLAIRWLLVAERRLALVAAKARRQALLEARAGKGGVEATGEGMPDLTELEEVNLATINEQTRRLLRVAALLVGAVMLAVIWSELLPAIGWLDDLVLWQYAEPGANGEGLVPVSLLDLAMALLVLVLMLFAGNNLPGLLEVALLQTMELDTGTRTAVTSLSRYLIYGAGSVLTLALLGIGWDDVQWLVAAMGVGLGFGLKEIFANLVSGLMILFERPIRIGDTVTVGEVSGTVTRIRIRATTITDWDNKELLVPNKNFIIDPLINWTLSDPVTRILIKVGIAYGSDTEKAHRVMSEVINNHPDVLKEPIPTVFFLGFGESSLDFEIRVFVNESLKRLPLMHDLHMALERALREAGVEIPFPQRDLHLRSVDPDTGLGGGAGSGEGSD